MTTAKLPEGCVIRTHVVVLERKEEPVYDEKIGWKLALICGAVSMFFAGFFVYGIWKAVELFLERVGLGG